MKKLKSLVKFKANKSNQLVNEASFNIRGGIGGGINENAPTFDNVAVSTDTNPNQDTDCGTQVVDDSGNDVLLIVDKETFNQH